MYVDLFLALSVWNRRLYQQLDLQMVLIDLEKCFILLNNTLNFGKLASTVWVGIYVIIQAQYLKLASIIQQKIYPMHTASVHHLLQY